MNLDGQHSGQTATIVGKGPSLLSLTTADFQPGPVITLNHAILRVRELGLPNPIYTMQKDGCVEHGPKAIPPLGCVCPDPRVVPPLPDETVILSSAESPLCFPDHPLRIVFDIQRDFGLKWSTMSAPVAVRIARLMGCRAVRMLGHDAYTSDDGRRVDGELLVEGPLEGYRSAGRQVARYAREAGLRLVWA